MGHKYVKEDDTFSVTQNGVVPKPTAADITGNKVLQANGQWVAQSGGGGGGSSHTYSTNEQVIGTWIDGTPVYEITVESTTTRDGSVSTSQSVSTGASDIKELIDLRGAVSYGANTAWLPFTFSDNASSGLTNSRVKIIAVGNDGNVFFEIGNNYNGANCINKVIITIRYTKTTG